MINLVVGVALRRAGRRHRSLTLDADGRHLLPDVWTSVGVLAGVGAVALTGWERLDPLIALAVAVNIVVTGVALVRRATGGLLDRALPDAERVLDEFGAENGAFTPCAPARRAGAPSLRCTSPGRWRVQRGHDLLERVEAAVRAVLPGLTVFTHREPLEDPASQADTGLDRADGADVAGQPAQRPAEGPSPRPR